MIRADPALTNATNWLAVHPRLTALILIAAILVAGNMDRSLLP